MAPQERNTVTKEEQDKTVDSNMEQGSSDQSAAEAEVKRSEDGGNMTSIDDRVGTIETVDGKGTNGIDGIKKGSQRESIRKNGDRNGFVEDDIKNDARKLNFNTTEAKSKQNGGFVNNAFEHDSKDTQDTNRARRVSINERDEKRKPDSSEICENLDFDDILPYLGEFGCYQKILFLLMIPFAFFVSFVYFSQIFMTLAPEDYWCRVPELENMPLEERWRLAIPIDEDGVRSRCTEYDVDWAEVFASGGSRDPNKTWPIRKCLHGWEYSDDVPYPTITTELDWVCEKDGLPATAQAVFFCGAIVGGFLFGWLADKYGRIPSLVGTNVVGFVAGVSTAWCHSFWSFCVCRFLVGLAFDNCFTMMYILVLEYVGPKWRTFVANMSIALFFTLATCLLPWIAYFIGDWRWFAVATSAPLLLAVATPWTVPESARWLVSQGKIEEAGVILKKFEKINKSKIPEKALHDFNETCLRIKKEEETSGHTYSVLELFKTPRLRKTVLLLVVIWMIISLVFDGHVRNVGSLGLDVFLTFTVAAATELPADSFLTLVLDKWGRRWLACGSMVFSGIFSLAAVAVPMGAPSASLAIMGRFAVNISYNIGLQYAAELLPTVVRAQGVALIHITGYIGSLVSPFIVYLVTVHQSLPLTILGVLGVIGGLLCLFLPETVDKVLPQTMQDGEDFGKNQKFWDTPCTGSRSRDKSPEGSPSYQRRASVASVASMNSMGSGTISRPGLLGFAGSRASIRLSTRQRSRRVSMETDR